MFHSFVKIIYGVSSFSQRRHYRHHPTDGQHHLRRMLEYLPPSVDWREAGVLSPVHDQGRCNSCWAFTAAGAVEAALKIEKNISIELSPQQLVDCDIGNWGCSSGLAQRAFHYIIARGLTTAKNYPYRGNKRRCRRHRIIAPTAKIDHFTLVSRNEMALMEAVSKQPIAVAIKVDREFYQYEGGILRRGRLLREPDHELLLTGYGQTEEGELYWWLKNSWGTEWGEDGYARLRMGGNRYGLKGIAYDPSYPVVGGADVRRLKEIADPSSSSHLVGGN